MLMDAAEVPKFHQRKQHVDNKPWVINVQNCGVAAMGKSMTAVHLAACLSLNLDKRYRIRLIDLIHKVLCVCS